MSDIHGNYEKYTTALEVISFNEDDTLFVLGDVVDRGNNSMMILLDMMCRFNVMPILGNHEFMALSVLRVLTKEITDDTLSEFDEDFLTGMGHWIEDGGQATLNEFNSLSQDERESILEYLEEFQLYDEVSVGGKDYVLVHAGLSNFSENKRLDNYELHELIFEKPDYGKVYFKDKILVTGHAPTRLIVPDSDKIYKANNHIAIDCGCGFGGKLDTLAAGFEQQLDKLFKSDAIDITSDISVLEKMMARDGLTGENPLAQALADRQA
jgi:serine/threonine protein phosphatase 1